MRKRITNKSGGNRMIKLFDNGAYLLNGTELVEDNAETPVYPNRACRGECEPCGEMIWR